MTPIYGGIEAGGTEFVCAVASARGGIVAMGDPIPTTTPSETLERVVEFFLPHGDLRAIGIGSFGPIDPNPESPSWGYITNTPKPGWHGTRFAPFIAERLRTRVAFDTDVNAAALGEFKKGAARGIDQFVYLTIGTGIGGGGMVNGKLMHGLTHPEMGHIRIPRALGDVWPGSCPFHGDCLEGLASGSALRARWGIPPRDLADDHPAWSYEARYLALGVCNLVATLSPRTIILGGGVMRHSGLLEEVRRELDVLRNGYFPAPPLVLPELGDAAGVQGAIALAMNAAIKGKR